jgi:hypothetical protein
MIRKEGMGDGVNARRRDSNSVHRLRKNVLKVWMNESDLPLAPCSVVSSSSVVLPCDDIVDDDDDDEDDDGERAKMRVAKSSYFAWESRGFWPKRPKAHGAVVDVGNKEKGAEEDEDILERFGCCVRV